MSRSDEKRLIPRKEAAEIYGIPPRFLEVAAMNGTGPKFIKVGRLCYYRMADIERWLDARTINTTAEFRSAGGES